MYSEPMKTLSVVAICVIGNPHRLGFLAVDRHQFLRIVGRESGEQVSQIFMRAPAFTI